MHKHSNKYKGLNYKAEQTQEKNQKFGREFSPGLYEYLRSTWRNMVHVSDSLNKFIQPKSYASYERHKKHSVLVAGTPCNVSNHNCFVSFSFYSKILVFIMKWWCIESCFHSESWGQGTLPEMVWGVTREDGGEQFTEKSYRRLPPGHLASHLPVKDPFSEKSTAESNNTEGKASDLEKDCIPLSSPPSNHFKSLILLLCGRVRYGKPRSLLRTSTANV